MNIYLFQCIYSKMNELDKNYENSVIKTQLNEIMD